MKASNPRDKIRLNGGLGIHWNFHIGEYENYKFLVLCVEPAWT